MCLLHKVYRSRIWFPTSSHYFNRALASFCIESKSAPLITKYPEIPILLTTRMYLWIPLLKPLLCFGPVNSILQSITMIMSFRKWRKREKSQYNYHTESIFVLSILLTSEVCQYWDCSYNITPDQGFEPQLCLLIFILFLTCWNPCFMPKKLFCTLFML